MQNVLALPALSRIDLLNEDQIGKNAVPWHPGGATPSVPVGLNITGQKMWVAAHQGRRTANLQACDLHLWCAVRELNPQPADSDYSLVDTWRPLETIAPQRDPAILTTGRLWSLVVGCRQTMCRKVCLMVIRRSPGLGATGSAGVSRKRFGSR
jgi:hypothetical protein